MQNTLKHSVNNLEDIEDVIIKQIEIYEDKFKEFPEKIFMSSILFDKLNLLYSMRLKIYNKELLNQNKSFGEFCGIPINVFESRKMEFHFSNGGHKLIY